MGREDHDRELTDLVQRLREDEVIVCEPEDFINGRIEVHKPTTKELEAADAIEAQAKRIAELEAALNNLLIYGCPACSGDCSSANPPVLDCPMSAARKVLGEKE